MKRLGFGANVPVGNGPFLALATGGCYWQSYRQAVRCGQWLRCCRSIVAKSDIKMKSEVEKRHEVVRWSPSEAPKVASRQIDAARFDAARFGAAPLRQIE
jgi:hypothetical protein